VPVSTLWYRDLRVGRLTEVFTSDDTWYATIELSTVDAAVTAYVAFCVDWNERQRGSDPPGAEEFEAYAEVISGGRYVTGRDAAVHVDRR
jgi:hypothetical protein